MDKAHEVDKDYFFELITDTYKEFHKPNFAERVVLESQPITPINNIPYNGITGVDCDPIVSSKLSIRPFNSNCWLTTQDAEKEGLTLKHGEKPVKLDIADKVNCIFINYEQLDSKSQDKVNLKPKDLSAVKKWENIPEIDEFISKQGVNIYRNSFDTAFAVVGTKDIHLLPDENMKSANQFYRFVLHELAHSTATDLNRGNPFESVYSHSKEELVAEFTAHKLCKSFGVESKLVTGLYLDATLDQVKMHNKENSRKYDIAELVDSVIIESKKAFNLICERGISPNIEGKLTNENSPTNENNPTNKVENNLRASLAKLVEKKVNLNIDNRNKNNDLSI